MNNAKAQHTPGPWRAHLGVESSHTTLITAKNVSIARPFDICEGGKSGGIYRQAETYANANLIAAAPDLLASCKELVLRLKSLDERLLAATGHSADHDLGEIVRGNAAINKALTGAK